MYRIRIKDCKMIGIDKLSKVIDKAVPGESDALQERIAGFIG